MGTTNSHAPWHEIDFYRLSIIIECQQSDDHDEDDDDDDDNLIADCVGVEETELGKICQRICIH